MSLALNAHNSKASEVYSTLTADNLYWRVYIYSDDFIKKQTTIPSKFHDLTARFFATLWKDCFQNKIDKNRQKYHFPISYKIIPNNLLFEINSHIDQEIRMFLYDQKASNLDEKLANVMALGKVAIKAKDLILFSGAEHMQAPSEFNDNNKKSTQNKLGAVPDNHLR